MASNPYRCKAKSGFVTSSEENVALDEGITEYFATLVEPSEKKYYPIETLVVELLAYSYDLYIFKDYFTADYQSFLNQFPNPEAINRLSKKLDIHYMEYDNTSSKSSPLQQKKIELLQKDIIKDIFEYCTQKSSNKINYSQLNRIRKFANIDASRRKRRLDFPIAKYIYDVKKFVEKNPVVDKKHDIEIFIGMYTIQYANSIANLIVDDKEYIEYLYSLLYDLWKILVIERRKNNQIHLSLFELLWSRKEDLINIYGGSNKIKNFFLDELIDNIKTETENTESENTEEEFDDFEKTEKKTLEQIKDDLKTVIHKDYDYYIYSNEDGSNARFLEKQENTKRTMTSESIIFSEPENEEDKGKFGDLSLFETTDQDAPF